MKFALDGAPASAYGHPGACSEPASGSVNAGGTVTYNGTPIGSNATSTIDVPSHGHDTNVDGDCIDYQSHSVPVETAITVTYDGTQMFTVDSNVSTDPGTGSNIDIDSSGGNNTVSYNG